MNRDAILARLLGAHGCCMCEEGEENHERPQSSRVAWSHPRRHRLLGAIVASATIAGPGVTFIESAGAVPAAPERIERSSCIITQAQWRPPWLGTTAAPQAGDAGLLVASRSPSLRMAVVLMSHSTRRTARCFTRLIQTRQSASLPRQSGLREKHHGTHLAQTLSAKSTCGD